MEETRFHDIMYSRVFEATLKSLDWSLKDPEALATGMGLEGGTARDFCTRFRQSERADDWLTDYRRGELKDQIRGLTASSSTTELSRLHARLDDRENRDPPFLFNIVLNGKKEPLYIGWDRRYVKHEHSRPSDLDKNRRFPSGSEAYWRTYSHGESGEIDNDGDEAAWLSNCEAVALELLPSGTQHVGVYVGNIYKPPEGDREPCGWNQWSPFDLFWMLDKQEFWVATNVSPPSRSRSPADKAPPTGRIALLLPEPSDMWFRVGRLNGLFEGDVSLDIFEDCTGFRKTPALRVNGRTVPEYAQAPYNEQMDGPPVNIRATLEARRRRQNGGEEQTWARGIVSFLAFLALLAILYQF